MTDLAEPKAGLGEEAAAIALSEALRALRAPTVDIEGFAGRLADALDHAALAAGAARTAVASNSLDSIMTGALRTVLAAEAAEKALGALKGEIGLLQAEARAMKERARTALGRAFADTGCPKVETEDHSATGTEGRFSIEIDDIDALPVDCVTWVKMPLLEVIEARFLAKQPVPGARRIQGEAGIRITAKRTKQSKGSRTQ